MTKKELLRKLEGILSQVDRIAAKTHDDLVNVYYRLDNIIMSLDDILVKVNEQRVETGKEEQMARTKKKKNAKKGK